ncbi:MAG: DUF87 domain-containing protein, partial [Candidatus Aenigmatarchaeota archaeon]
QEFSINITLNNTGGSRAKDVNLSVMTCENVSSEPNLLYYGLIPKLSSKSNITTITIAANTTPGLYYSNLTAVWTNLNGTFASNNLTLEINVGENQFVHALEEKLTMFIEAGTNQTSHFNVKSAGNVIAKNISFVCYSGEVCENFTVSFAPQNISELEVGETAKINITVEVPVNYIYGSHFGIVRINYEEEYSELLLEVKVPMNISWEQVPLELKKKVFGNETGVFGTIKIINTGNIPIPLNISLNESISEVLSLNVTQFTLGYGETKVIGINYSSPDVALDSNFTGFITSKIIGDLAQNSSVKERASYLELYVYSYKVHVISPSKDSPILNVNPSDLLLAKVNVTSNSTPVTASVIFNVSIYNSSLSSTAILASTQFNSSDSLWYLRFYAPALDLARIYSLNITANYTLFEGRVKYALAEDSIVYNDTIKPEIEIWIPVRIAANTSVPIKVNVTEAAGLKNVSFWMSYPDNSIERIDLQFISKVNDVYTYATNFTNTSLLGIYNFSARACDLSGNCNELSKTFEIYPTAFFAGYAKDVESQQEPPLLVNFLFYDVNTSLLRFNFTSNVSTGYYNETIDVKSYDLIVSTQEEGFKNYIKFENLTIATHYFNPIILGKIPRLRTTSSALKGIYIDSVLNSSNITLIIDFSDCSGTNCGIQIYDPSHLGIYKYLGNWTPKISSSQNTLWTRISNIAGDNSDNSVNLSSLTARARISYGKGVYILAEFICGNGECESSFGESSVNCPIDCPTLPPTPTPPTPVIPPVPGIGPGVAPPAIPTVPTLVPVEIKTTLLETTLVPGEEKVFSVDITNNQENSVRATVTVEGPAFSLLTVQKPVLSVPAKSTEVVNIRAYAPPTAIPGIYPGEIVVTVENITHRTPITIKIETVLEPLLDVKVKVLSKTVAPGQNLVFEVSLLNMGQTAKIEDITVTYNIKLLSDPTKIIATSKETLAVENVLTYTREIQIPESAPQDKYVLEVNASYWYGKKYAISTDSFEVSQLPVPLMVLRAILLNPLTYIVIFLGVPSFVIGARWYAAYKAAKLAKARYIAPIDFKSLPKPGPTAIEVGKIAETDVKAYIDTSQLIMHSIAAGGTGSGKSVSAMVCAEELLKRKVPVIVFDPTAQWTGFMKPCKLKAMLDLYPKFGLKPTDARSFKTNVVLVEDPDMPIDLKKYMNPGEITVFVMNRLKPEELDKFVRRSVQAVFDMRPPESKEIKLLMVWDEVHRLLPKYGGKGGYVAIERACREFRKWGIGVFVISQVLLDFKGAIRANIANEIQLRTKYEGDIARVKSKYGADYASKVTRLTIGTALFQNPEYNHGRPWFISFRPLLHSPFALTDEEINQYVKLNKKIEELEKKIEELKAKGVDTYDLEIELNIAKDKIKTAAFKMAETYIESVENRLEKGKR